MKQIFALCGVILVVGAALVWRAQHQPKRFGEFADARQVSVEELVSHPKEFAGKTVSVQGTVRDQSKTMGCSFYLTASSGRLRVELEAIAMEAPKREGHAVRVEGQIVPYGDAYQLYASGVEFQ